MSFKQALPDSLYRQVVAAHPYRFRRPGSPRAREVMIDGRWTLRLEPGCGPLARRAARDFAALMKTTFGKTLQPTARRADGPAIRIAVDAAGLHQPESYRLHVANDGVRIDAFDDEGAMRALFHLRWRMLNRRGPFLPRGHSTHVPQWSLRIGSPLVHRPLDSPRDYLELPPAYLMNMARYGYNATYIYLDWFDYMRPQIAGALARPGYARRLADLAAAAAYLRSYGIRLLFHVNTLALSKDHALFRAAPAMRGAQSWSEGLHCLCSGSPQVIELYERSAQQLFNDVPDLAGAVIITGGECFLHCYTRPTPKPTEGTNCPVCARKRPARVIGDVVNAFACGARLARPEALVLMWPYSAFSWGDLHEQKRLIRRLDHRIGHLAPFEKDGWIDIEGQRGFVFDYSIASLGPSSLYTQLAAEARRHGMKTYAKTETAQCIEMFNVPRIPIMHRWAERFARMQANGIDGVHTTWRFYGFCAQRNDEIVDRFAWQGDVDIERMLREMAVRDFGPAAADVIRAWRIFSAAFARFPYSAGLSGFPYFRGPFSLGPAHPLVFDLSADLGLPADFWSVDPSSGEGLRDADVAALPRQPRFFLDLTWTQPYGGRIVARRLTQVHRQWRHGMTWLQRATAATRGLESQRLQNEIDVALVVGSMFRTGANLARFQLLRQQVTAEPSTAASLRQACLGAVGVAKDELDNAQAALAAVRRDPSLGFGTTYGTAFDAHLIEQKIRHTRREIRQMIPQFYKVHLFHMFGRYENLAE